jgi:hypothetical protein
MAFVFGFLLGLATAPFLKAGYRWLSARFQGRLEN